MTLVRQLQKRGWVVVVGMLTALAAPLAVHQASADLAGTRVEGTLTLSPTTAAPGAEVRLAGRVPPKTTHKVKLQRLDAGHFVTLTTRRTDRAGRFTFRTTLPRDRAAASYRVLSPRTLDPRTGRRRSYVTPTRTATIVVPTPVASPTPTPTPTPTPPTSTPTAAPTTPAPTRPPVEYSGALQRLGWGFAPAIAADGSKVVYLSSTYAVSVWDETTGESVPVVPAGAWGASYWPSISSDGRYVAYHSYRPDLVPDDTNQTVDAFTTDRLDGSTRRVGVGDSYPSISGDGRFVAFGLDRVSVWDRTTGTSVPVAGGNGPSGYPSISADGRFVAFRSEASDLVAGDTNGQPDVFLWDRVTGTTAPVTKGNGPSDPPEVSSDGRYVAFRSAASNLVSGDTNGTADVFVWDRVNATTTQVTHGNGPSGSPDISGDGRFVAFESAASDLVAEDGNHVADVFVWDGSTGTTIRLTDGDQNSVTPAISDDGARVSFMSTATNLVPGDYGWEMSVFLWRRGAS